MTSRNIDFLTFTAHQKPTVGDTKISAVGIDHMGWLLCDGRLVNVEDYLFLFNVIKYSFGGSGGQFALPNPAGRVPGVIGSGDGLTTRAMGSNVGEETHTLTVGEMPTHSHTGTTDSSTTGITTNTNAPSVGLAQRTGSNTFTTSDSSAGELDLVNAAQLTLTDPGHVHTFTTNTTGGSNAHNNMQPTLFVGNMFIYCGKVGQGAYPYTEGYYSYPAINDFSGANIL